jgi:hypothetical protein
MDIRLLAACWNTSQEGAVRGAVAEAVRELQALPTVQQALQQYRAGEVARDGLRRSGAPDTTEYGCFSSVGA